MHFNVDASKTVISPTKEIVTDSSTVFKNSGFHDAKNTNATFETSFLGN